MALDVLLLGVSVSISALRQPIQSLELSRGPSCGLRFCSRVPDVCKSHVSLSSSANPSFFGALPEASPTQRSQWRQLDLP